MVPDSLSIHQRTTHRWSLFRDLVGYASSGFSRIGLCRSKVEEIGLAETADLLAEMQMRVTSLSSAGGFTGSNGQSFTESVEDARQMIWAASVLGAGTLVIHPGGSNGHTSRHLRRLFSLALDELVPEARDLDVRLAVEPVCGPETKSAGFATDFCSTLELISAWPGSLVGIVADLFHLSRDPQAVRCFPGFVDRVALVRMSDLRMVSGRRAVRCLPGTGCLPIRSWLNRLKHSRYSGPVELEMHGPEFENLGHEDVLVALREFMREDFQPVVFEEARPGDGGGKVHGDSSVESRKLN